MSDAQRKGLCPYCDATIIDSSVRGRHIQEVHPDVIITGVLKDSCLSDVDMSDPPSSLESSGANRYISPSMESTQEEEPVRDDPEVQHRRATYLSAATEVLFLARRRPVPDLLQFLEDVHPEIPEEHRFALVIGAMAGAQTVAQLHFFAESNHNASDRTSREAVHDALARIAEYNLGVSSLVIPILFRSESELTENDNASHEDYEPLKEDSSRD